MADPQPEPVNGLISWTNSAETTKQFLWVNSNFISTPSPAQLWNEEQVRAQVPVWAGSSEEHTRQAEFCSEASAAASLPDGNDVGEEQQESDDLQVPTACKVLKGHHDQGHHHQSPKEDLGETVHLQIKETNLEWQERGISAQMKVSAQCNIYKGTELPFHPKSHSPLDSFSSLKTLQTYFNL